MNLPEGYSPFAPYPKTPPKTGRELDRGVLSNVLGGAFHGKPSPDGTRLAYENGAPNGGYDVYEIKLDRAAWLPARDYVDDKPAPTDIPDDEWDWDGLEDALQEQFGVEFELQPAAVDEVAKTVWPKVEERLAEREKELTRPWLMYFTRHFLLEEIDNQWIEHLKTMEALREGIGLRGYGQKDPKQEYKKEGFAVFGEMVGIIGRNVCEKLFHMQVVREDGTTAQPPQPQRKPRRTIESGGGATPRAASGDGQPAQDESKPVRRDQPKVGRNDPCPCGSGKKYKKCHGAVATV